jgi:ribonuclease VapC
MADAALDASALLAYLLGEPGADLVEEHLVRRSAISAVNWCEVAGKLIDAGAPCEEGVPRVLRRGGLGELLDVHAFERPDAEAAAGLRAATRALGLSLGDRACLALAQRLGVPALTADRAWTELELAIEVIPIR